MTEQNNPDLYVCALLTQMVTAREGDVRREFQAVVRVMQRLREYSEEDVLKLIQSALALDESNDLQALVDLCKTQLDDDQIREAIGLLAFLARIDGDVSPEEEGVFARLCVGLGVVMQDGQVTITR